MSRTLYCFDLRGLASANEYVELIKMFLRPSEFKVVTDDGTARHARVISKDGLSADRSEYEPALLKDKPALPKDMPALAKDKPTECAPDMIDDGILEHLPASVRNTFTVELKAANAVLSADSKNDIKRLIYKFLVCRGLKAPDWGILTGVRPVKLFGELSASYGTENARRMLKEEYYLSSAKINLLNRIYDVQKKAIQKPAYGNIAVYIGIPFCPSRCEYCSFPSNQVQYDQTVIYMNALADEIRFAADGMRNRGWSAETIYIGGGTPALLKERELGSLLELCLSAFGGALKEFTVEVGRPDTVNTDKLKLLKDHGVNRICVNPQTLNDQTLQLIGRNHDSASFERAFYLARESDIPVINTDIIAGLPGELPEDFRYTLKGILRCAPENITVHTLALKRAARLKEQDSEYHYERGADAVEMLKIVEETLAPAGYEPYYLYRQKQTAGNLENIGYAKGDTCCLYNMRIMEENQTVLALGAGGATKVYYPESNRLERIFNVSDYKIYIDRIDEMLERKKNLLFGN